MNLTPARKYAILTAAAWTLLVVLSLSWSEVLGDPARDSLRFATAVGSVYFPAAAVLEALGIEPRSHWPSRAS